MHPHPCSTQAFPQCWLAVLREALLIVDVQADDARAFGFGPGMRRPSSRNCCKVQLKVLLLPNSNWAPGSPHDMPSRCSTRHNKETGRYDIVVLV